MFWSDKCGTSAATARKRASRAIEMKLITISTVAAAAADEHISNKMSISNKLIFHLQTFHLSKMFPLANPFLSR